jgi:hypothetical protein
MSLASLQDRLQNIYEVYPGHNVDDFLITDPRLADQLDNSFNARITKEKLLIRQDENELRLSLYIDEKIIEDLGRKCSSPDAAQLSSHCLAVEGVSHFLFLAWRARYGHNVTAIEMELQAEIDKFVIVIQSWAHCSDRQDALRHWLFENVKFADDLTRKERDRYQDANTYAAKYCRWLQCEYLQQRRHQELLKELRRFYRLGRAEKLRHINQAC